MKCKFLLFATALTLSMGAQAQNQKVQQFFRVSDPTFVINNWGDNNEINVRTNSFTLGSAFNAVAWDFGGNFWDQQGLDLSKYDKMVIRLKSVVGNSVQFRIYDYAALNGNGAEYAMPDDIVQMDDEVEYEVPLADGLEDINGRVLDLSCVKRFSFWNYWDVDGDKTNPDNEHYDSDFVDEHPGADVTVTISAMYLERTLANGEKDYYDLMGSNNKMQFTDDFLADEGGVPSYIDNAGAIHMNENAEGGYFYDEEPVDWSNYRYLCIVPQKPYKDGDPTIRYLLTDQDDNVFDSGWFRYGFWNRSRAAVQDLTTITSTPLDDDTNLESFDTKAISSLKWSLWGGVSTWEYGVAGVWLSNTCPSYSTGFGDGTDNTGDYIIENASENTVMTICLPFAAALCGAQVYDVAGVDDPANPSELYAAPHVGILEAGKPYIIRTNSDSNVTAFRAGANEVAAPSDNGALTAPSFQTYYVEAGKNYLVLNEDGDTFEGVVDDDIRLNSNSAYIDCSKLSQAEEAQNGLVFSLSNVQPFTPSGIAEINADKKNAPKGESIYDLQGRRVSHPTQGIYVKNGKKFVVK